MANTIYIVAGTVAVLLVARYFAVWRGRALAADSQQGADGLQSYLTTCVNDLRRVLAQTHKEPEAIRREAYAILARMESRNPGGILNDFIQDNRESVDLALKPGDAA